MLAINGTLERNLILFIRARSEAAYIHFKPEETDAL
jgi:hypothetical protein